MSADDAARHPLSPVPGDAELEELLAGELDTLTATIDGPTRARHIAAAAAEARANTRVRAFPAALPRRRRVVAAGMAAAAAAAVVLSLASARLLPGPIQATVAHIAERVGIHLPDHEDAEPPRGPDTGIVDRTGRPASATRPAGTRPASEDGAGPSTPGTTPAGPSTSMRPGSEAAPPSVPATPAPSVGANPIAPDTPTAPEAPTAPTPPPAPEIGDRPAPPEVPEPPPVTPPEGLPGTDVPVVTAPPAPAP